VKKMKKMIYTTPAIGIAVVELEQGIAASSATLSGGEPPNQNAPEVIGWGAEELGGSTSGDF
jgi:hypothetical protein